LKIDIENGDSPQAPEKGSPESGELVKKELPKKKQTEAKELKDIINNLTEELKKREEELRAADEMAKRAVAEMENFKKRIAREREEESRYARASLVEALLPVLDNLEKAVEASKEEGSDPNSLREGVEMVRRQLADILARNGLEKVTSLGKDFDPETMEAVHMIESEQHDDGVVTAEFSPGYRFKDRLIRHAKVQVSKNSGSNN